MVAIMKRPRAKKINKFKKRSNKPKVPLGKPQDAEPRKLPENEMEAKVHLITQDIKFAQALAGNDKKVRDKFLKNLKKWLSQRNNTSYPFSDQDFLRLWKGLFYCMWMSDKPLIQEQLCEDMGSLFYCFEEPTVAVQFYGRFLETICQEWLGIDHWRLDKFMMLVRRVTRHLFTVMHKHEWSPELLKVFRRELSATIFKEGTLSFGCTMHYLSLFWEEVAKVSDGKISARAVTGLIKPYLAFLTDTRDQRLSKRVVVDIFYGLLKQSDLGRQHEEKYEVWKQFGFPSDRISDMEMVEDDGENQEEEEEMVDEDPSQEDSSPSDDRIPEEQLALDPRAGNVSVVLPEIPFNARKIHQLMEKTYYDAGTRSANRKVIKKVMAHYEKFSTGQYPLGVQRVVLPANEARKLPNIDEKVQELDALQEEVLEDTRLMRTLSKGEKKRYYKSGMTPREYLVSLGKIREEVDETNGMVVEEIAEEEEQSGNQNGTKNKKRKAKEAAIQNGENKSEKINVKKQKKDESKDTSLEIDNGFEVEVDESASAVQQDEGQVKEVVSKKVKTNNKKAPTTTATNGSSVFDESSEWDKPLEEGELEYFVTPTKQRLKHLNGDLDDRSVNVKPAKNSNGVVGGSVKKQKNKNTLLTGNGAPASPKTPVNKLTAAAAAGQLRTPNSSGKRVQIMLEKNMAQEKSEYFRQLRNSPQIPFDSTKKPAKGLLKPHSMPSPINPYYKKKIGLKLDGDE